MLGQATPQRDLFSTESTYREKIKENSFMIGWCGGCTCHLWN